MLVFLPNYHKLFVYPPTLSSSHWASNKSFVRSTLIPELVTTVVSLSTRLLTLCVKLITVFLRYWFINGSFVLHSFYLFDFVFQPCENHWSTWPYGKCLYSVCCPSQSTVSFITMIYRHNWNPRHTISVHLWRSSHLSYKTLNTVFLSDYRS